MSIDYTYNANSRTLLIKIYGHFDFGAFHYFNEIIEKIQNNMGLIVVDFKATNYIDSAGLGMLVALLNKAKNYRYPIVFMNTSTEVRNILTAANFDKIMKLYNSLINA